MSTDTVGDSLPPFGPSPETTPPSVPTTPPVESAPRGSPADPAPPVEFLPFVDEAEEKRRFIQVVLITIAVFFVITVLIVGFVVSQRLSSPASSKVNVQYIDSSGDSVALPTRQPTRGLTSVKTTIQPTSYSFVKIPTSAPKPSAQITYIVQKTGTVTPGSATIPVSTATLTPTPNGSITPTVTLLPTMTPTITPTITNTPTITPTPTSYLVTSVDSYNFSTVYAGSSVTATFQIYNVGGSSLTISALSITGDTNSPYSITTGGGCITQANTPVIMQNNSIKCINVLAAPTYSSNTVVQNLQILWNGANVKNIALSISVPTPTPTPTP
ncbi:hypothetical protein KBB12_01265 [Candidatus Woesebacteria bacterium]|nr:hypothetical protein [Candidatus Woesebacteria bacterium]